MVDGRKLSGDALECLLEHGQAIFNIEPAPDGLPGRSRPIPVSPVECENGRAVQRLSVLVGTQVSVLTKVPRPS